MSPSDAEAALNFAFDTDLLAFMNDSMQISYSVEFGGAVRTNNEAFYRTLAQAEAKKNLQSQGLAEKPQAYAFRKGRDHYNYISFAFTAKGKSGAISFFENMQDGYIYVAIVSSAIGVCFLIVLGSFLGLGRFVAKKALSPLANIAASVRNVTEANMAMPALPEKASSEVDSLLIELNNMLFRLESSFEEQRRFVSDVSHELRIPLTIIQGYIDIISSWGREDALLLSESLEAITIEISNMKSLVDRLLFLQNLGNGNISVNMIEIPVGPLVEKVADEAKLLGSGHIFKSQPKARYTAILADAVLLEQSMRSAVDNAIKYSSPGSAITIGCETDKGKAILYITDSGPGIPAEHLAKVKQRFYRVDSARSKKPAGSGLGLSIIEASIKAIGGVFALDSQEGKGTTVRFIFPIIPRSHRSRPSSPP
jgi:signal transduction histidine kinase